MANNHICFVLDFRKPPLWFYYLFLMLLVPGSSAQAQNGGRQVFPWLNSPVSPRLTALGGENMSINDQDVNLAYHNPATLNSAALGTLAVNYQFYYGGTKQGYVDYGFQPKKQSALLMHAGLKFMNYGEFQHADEFGQISGLFEAAEYIFTAGGSIPINNRWTFGTNLKFILSNLESYQASGLGVDLGVHYRFKDSLSWFGFAVRNLGGQLSTYYPGGPIDALPVRMAATLSTRLRYVPLRLFITAHQLERWRLRFDDQREPQTDIFGIPIPAPSATTKFVDNFFRHLIFGVEMPLGKPERLILRLGYNHFRKKELEVEAYRSFAGFSGGVGLNLGRLHLDYAFGTYHLAGSIHHLGLRVPFSSFFKKQIDL